MIKTRNTEKTRDLNMKNGETVELNTKNWEKHGGLNMKNGGTWGLNHQSLRFLSTKMEAAMSCLGHSLPHEPCTELRYAWLEF
jgi:hypothetical protein